MVIRLPTLESEDAITTDEKGGANSKTGAPH